MKTLFNQLYDYNFYCNRQLIEQCVGLKEIPGTATKLFNHILNAHHIWNSRILKRPTEYGVWQEHQIADWQDIHYENQRTSFEIITNTEDFEKRIDYETTEGRVSANELKDILFHVINHSTHHRAQIISDFRSHGIEPKSLDYIHYKR